MTPVTLPRLLAAAGIGIVYFWAAATAWGFLSVDNPFNELLLNALVRHERHLVAYRVIIHAYDIVVNLLIALPFAAVFRFLPMLRSWIYVALATATAVITIYRSTELAGPSFLLLSWVFWLGVAMAAFSLPVTFALLNRVRLGAAPLSPTQDAA